MRRRSEGRGVSLTFPGRHRLHTTAGAGPLKAFAPDTRRGPQLRLRLSSIAADPRFGARRPTPTGRSWARGLRPLQEHAVSADQWPLLYPVGRHTTRPQGQNLDPLGKPLPERASGGVLRAARQPVPSSTARPDLEIGHGLGTAASRSRRCDLSRLVGREVRRRIARPRARGGRSTPGMTVAQCPVLTSMAVLQVPTLSTRLPPFSTYALAARGIQPSGGHGDLRAPVVREELVGLPSPPSPRRSTPDLGRPVSRGRRPRVRARDPGGGSSPSRRSAATSASRPGRDRARPAGRAAPRQAEVARLIALAGDMVVCAGYSEASARGSTRRRRQRDGGTAFSATSKVIPTSAGRALRLHRRRRASRPSTPRSRGSRDAALLRQALPRGGARARSTAPRSSARWRPGRSTACPRAADPRRPPGRHFDLCDAPRGREPGRLGRRPTRPGAGAPLRFLGSAKVVDPEGRRARAHRRARGARGRRRSNRRGGARGSRLVIDHLADRRPDA